MQLDAVEYLRPVSDLHLDKDVQKRFKPEDLWMPPPLASDTNSVFLIAGDLWEDTKFFSFSNYSWIARVCAQFKYVVVVLGNHDYYGSELQAAHLKFEGMKTKLGLQNLFLLHNNKLSFGDTLTMWGSTFWTNFNNGDAKSMYYAKHGYPDKEQTFLRDFKSIRARGYSKMSANDWVSAHLVAKNSLMNFTRPAGHKSVVVTHHAPDYESIPDQWKYLEEGDFKWLVAGAYYTDMSEFLKSTSEVDLWIHGHTHEARKYRRGNTDILVNPRGYGVYEKYPTGWDDKLVIDIASI